MVITYQGGAFVKVQFGDITIAVNPISKDSKKLKPSRFGADIALVSINDRDFNGVDQVSFGEKKAFAVTGPGEYEIKDVFIKGFKSDSKYGGEERINTIYTVHLENMNLCFLGALELSEGKNLPDEASEALDDVDILFVPIGADGVMAPSDAYKLAVKIEPKLIVPLYFGNAAALKAFLKEAGEESQKPQDKLTLKKKDLEGKEADVVVLEPAA
ncbi:MBL fold metallo-hydrolase [Candidatus Parcubacteria bacterium]|nr:MBL fold metallo-hydrolase [Candidatus Parcubacteria bacterium]